METPLLSKELFIQNSPIKEDTLVSKFATYIVSAQLEYLEDLLGDALYAELQTQINANNLTPNNRALIQKIAPALSHFAVYDGLPFHWAAIVNKGVTLRDSENSKALESDDLSYVLRRVKDKGYFFLRRLVKYLCKCRSNYPSWVPGDNCGGDCGKKDFKDDFAGIYLG